MCRYAQHGKRRVVAPVKQVLLRVRIGMKGERCTFYASLHNLTKIRVLKAGHIHAVRAKLGVFSDHFNINHTHDIVHILLLTKIPGTEPSDFFGGKSYEY